MTIRIGPEGRVYNSDVLLGDCFWIVTVVFVKTFFQSVIHGVDGGFAIFISRKSIEVGFLDEEE